MYVDSSGGQTIYGLTDVFKFSKTASGQRRRRGYHVLHLSNAKPVVVTKQAVFNAVYPGTRLDEGEFNYVSRDGFLRASNISVSGFDGISLDSDDTFAIPISYIASERIVVTNLDHLPEPIE